MNVSHIVLQTSNHEDERLSVSTPGGVMFQRIFV